MKHSSLPFSWFTISHSLPILTYFISKCPFPTMIVSIVNTFKNSQFFLDGLTFKDVFSDLFIFFNFLGVFINLTLICCEHADTQFWFQLVSCKQELHLSLLNVTKKI